MDKLQAIRFFLTLSETLSFKQTATHFGVPPSTVSRSLKALEKELGARLVERTTRRVRLTEAGEWYRAEVAAPLRALAAADEMVEAHSKEPSGRIRLTALPAYGDLRLFAVLDRFRATYPQILCDLELTYRLLDLSTGEIDVAIRATADPPDYLVARRLHSHRFFLVGTPGYFNTHGRPHTVRDLKRHAALAFRGPTGVLPWLATRPNGHVETVSRDPVLVTNHGMMLRNATLSGEGLCFLPGWAIEDELADGRLEVVTLDDAALSCVNGPESSVYLLYDPKRARLGRVRALVDFLVEALGEQRPPKTRP